MNFINLIKSRLFKSSSTDTITIKSESKTKLFDLDLSKIDDLAKEMNCSNEIVLNYLISLDSPRIDKGMVSAERTIKKLIIGGTNKQINTQTIRTRTGCNYNTALKVLHAYRQEVELLNGRPFLDSYFAKVKTDS
tara:strand:- start:97 stop:501 length:405 start_codon:yes stop_codon:yes gene_type:complete